MRRFLSVHSERDLHAAWEDGVRSLSFRQENFATANISEATVIFTNSLVFDAETLRLLEEKAASCPKLRYFVTTKMLPRVQLKQCPPPLEFNHLKMRWKEEGLPWVRGRGLARVRGRWLWRV